jgi:hypothetical protein
VILLLALLSGLVIGWAFARWQGRAYKLPHLRLVWLAFLAFVPQLVAFYLPLTRSRMPDSLAAASLITSQILLLAFAWANRELAGMWMLMTGLMFNLAVIAANGGFMPISPHTAARLISADVLQTLQPGARFGDGKDILLLPGNINLIWLSDCLLLPAWSHYQVAFSLGDVLIACGIFWLLVRQGRKFNLKRCRNDVVNPNIQHPAIRRTGSNQPL